MDGGSVGGLSGTIPTCSHMGVKADSLAAQQRPPERLHMDGKLWRTWMCDIRTTQEQLSRSHRRDACAPYANQRTNIETFPMGWASHEIAR